MLQRIAAEKTVDVFGFVMSLRRDRNIMVQVEEQYVFIHDVLLEAIHSGYTEIRASDLRAHMKNLMQVNPASGECFVLLRCNRCGDLMGSELDSGSSGAGSSPGRGNWVVFLGKTLNSHRVSLHPGV